MHRIHRYITFKLIPCLIVGHTHPNPYITTDIQRLRKTPCVPAHDNIIHHTPTWFSRSLINLTSNRNVASTSTPSNSCRLTRDVLLFPPCHWTQIALNWLPMLRDCYCIWSFPVLAYHFCNSEICQSVHILSKISFHLPAVVTNYYEFQPSSNLSSITTWAREHETFSLWWRQITRPVCLNAYRRC